MNMYVMSHTLVILPMTVEASNGGSECSKQKLPIHGNNSIPSSIRGVYNPTLAGGT